MVRIAAVAYPAEYTENLRPALQRRTFAFQHEVSRALAEVQPRTGLVEWTTTLCVQNHQRFEAVEMEQRQRLRTARHYNVSLAGLNQQLAHNQRVHRGRTSCGGSHGVVETVEIVGDFICGGATVVDVATGGLLFGEVVLGDVHTADRSAGDERQSVLLQQLRLLQRLL